MTGTQLDPEQARLAAIEELRRAVGFERWCWPLTDPDSGLAMSGIAEFDIWPSLPRFVALQEHGDILSKPRLLFGPQASIALSALTDGAIERSRTWKECLEPYGIGDMLLTACREREGCWGSVELMRDSDDRAFNDDEVRLLNDVSSMLGTLLRRTLARSWRQQPSDAGTPPPGTLVLDRELTASGWTSPAREWLEQLQPGGMLPAAVYEIGTRVLAQKESGAGESLPARVRIRTAAGRWSVVEGAMLEGGDEDRVAITLRAATADDVADILCRAHGLTPRERELVGLLRAGLATKGVSDSLGISPYTVQDHLKAIFDKTGVHSRSELISHLIGSAP